MFKAVKMRIFVFSVAMVFLLDSCGPYHKALNKGTVKEQYKMAVDMYDAKKYSKAIRLFELVIPAYSGKPQMERIQYMTAQAHFNLKDYESAAYYFERFVTNYPRSSKLEEASFLSCKSYFLSSPKYSVDQKQTLKAMEALQLFLFKFPNSKRRGSINTMMDTLEHKLQKKRFEIAKQYYKIRYYKAANTAFDSFLSEFLGTDYKEEALYYKFLSSYELAVNSTPAKKAIRVKSAIKSFEKLEKNFPTSKYLKSSESKFKKLKSIIL